ncbi:peroxidase [Marchantia polymorpha subsp. ruderalis]
MASASATGHNALLVSIILLATECACTAETPYAAGLSEDFYEKTCPQAASNVDAYVTKFLRKDRNFAGAFNRLQFHDCWAGNSTQTNQAEREAHVNFGLRGVAEVDQIKAALEHSCPGVVSCADILIMVARDATAKVGGPTWPVAMGRRDGVNSTSLMADSNLPFPVLNFSGLVANLAAKGFNAREMITLSGAHTIGRTHCNGILPHLYNFTGKDDATGTDPAMNKNFAVFLKKHCPQGNTTNTIFIDSTAITFDRAYYKSVLQGKGIFITDAALITNPAGKKVVTTFSKPGSTFFTEFAAGMVKMGNLGVLTGTEGAIRRTCQFVN